jgi:hypothetical protein
VADEQTNLPNRSPAERYYTEHVRISPDEGGDNELLRADANEKLRRGWRLVSMTKDQGEDSVELVWDTSGASERFWKPPRYLVVVMLWIGGAMMLVASALLVYLAAVLVARFVAL